MSMISRKYLLVPFLLSLFLAMIISPAGAAFTNPPTFDLTTNNSFAGALNAIYTFHFENPDPSEVAVAFTVVVPAGYFVNPSYMTTTAGIVVMSGYYDVVGDYSAPYLGTVEIKTTAVSGVFEIFRNSVSEGALALALPTATTPGSFGGILPNLNDGFWGEVNTVPGFLINPSTPGLYTWGPNTATPTSGPTVPMNPRGGKTNQVNIVGTPLYFNEPYIDVTVGSTFTVTVSIKPSLLVESFNFKVEWNPSLMEYVEGTIGMYLPTGWTISSYDTTVPGFVSLQMSGSPPVDGTHTWLTITLRCKAVGPASIQIEDGTIILYEDPDAIATDPYVISVNQRQASSTPTGTQHVGGELFTANKLAVLSPYLALIGLAGVVASAAVVTKKRRRE